MNRDSYQDFREPWPKSLNEEEQEEIQNDLLDNIVLIFRIIKVKGIKSFTNFDNYNQIDNIKLAFNIYRND